MDSILVCSLFSFFKSFVQSIFSDFFSEPTFCFKYKFGVTQQYSSDPLYKEQRKTVKTENAVTSMKTLVGSIGGTLGMFVGYSLIGTIEWLTSICANFKMRWTQKSGSKL